MKVMVAVAELKGVRVAIAFPAPGWVVPGMGDALLARLQPYYPTLPLMLVSQQAHRVRAHAAFQAGALVEGCDLSGLELCEVDLETPPARPEEPLPF